MCHSQYQGLNVYPCMTCNYIKDLNQKMFQRKCLFNMINFHHGSENKSNTTVIVITTTIVICLLFSTLSNMGKGRSAIKQLSHDHFELPWLRELVINQTTMKDQNKNGLLQYYKDQLLDNESEERIMKPVKILIIAFPR